MSISEELQRLDELRRSGAITWDDYELAKRRVLDGGPPPVSQVVSETNSFPDALEQIRQQNEIAQLDREWELEREQYKVTGKHGRQYIPGKTSSVISGVIIVCFGAFWTMMASSIGGGMGGPASFFPLFGLLFIAFGVGMAIYSFTKASGYEQAQRRYKNRRNNLTRRDKF